VRVVILGNGIAGNAVASGIRKYNKLCKIIIVSGENAAGYDPGALPYYVSGDVPRKEVFLKHFEDYSRENTDLILENKAVELDVEQKQVYLENNDVLDYDKLVIATGSNLVIPPIRGVEKKNVFGFKILEDADRINRLTGNTAVVIGSGLIGIEVSEALRKKGFQVYLVELLDWIMPQVFDKKPAQILANELERNGIKVLTGEKVVSINGETRVSSVTTDKRSIICDTVILATGVIPASELAISAGIQTGKTKGITVDERMMTSVEDVYACGDCVESKNFFTGENGLYLLRHNALEQAEVAARNCVGNYCKYQGAWSFTRAHFFKTHAVAVGKTAASLQSLDHVEVIEQVKGKDYCRLIIHQGTLAGVQAIGALANNVGILMGAMWRGDNLNKIKSQRNQVLQLNSPYPWNFRIITRYMDLSQR